MSTSGAERDEMVRQVKGALGITEDSEAVRLLESHNWSVDSILRSTTTTTTTTTTSATAPAGSGAGSGGWLGGLASAAWWAVSSLWGGGQSTSGARAPADAHERFERELEAEHGASHVRLFQGRYLGALEAARETGLLLLVYLHSPSHPDSAAVCRGVLCSEAVSGFLEGRFVVWAGDVREMEAFELCDVLEVTAFPCFVVVLPGASGTQQRVLARVVGRQDAGAFVALLTSMLEGQAGQLLQSARAQQEDRRLRREQETEYEKALREDQEKDRKAQDEERRRREEEQCRKRASDERDARRRQRAQLAVAAEPPAGEPGVVTVAIRLPSGERVTRRFRSADCLECVYALVDLKCPSLGNYVLCTNFPRKSFPQQSAPSTTVSELGDQALLFVQEDESSS